eukprot:scaffold23754_cov106-Isochrysis_galbana.AAC.4
MQSGVPTRRIGGERPKSIGATSAAAKRSCIGCGETAGASIRRLSPGSQVGDGSVASPLASKGKSAAVTRRLFSLPCITTDDCPVHRQRRPPKVLPCAGED